MYDALCLMASSEQFISWLSNIHFVLDFFLGLFTTGTHEDA